MSRLKRVLGQADFSMIRYLQEMGILGSEGFLSRLPDG